MADIESNIRIDIDTTAALASIKNLQREISAFQSQMARGSASTVAKARDLQQNLINNVNSTGKFAANLTTIRTTTESFTNSLERNKLSMGEYFRYSAAASQTFGRNFVSEFNTIEKVARERVKTLQTQYIKLGRDANGAMQAIAVRPLALDMNDVATRTAIAAQKQQLFNQLLKQGSTNLLNFGKNTQWAGRQLMVGFTIPLTMLGTVAAQTFMQMEQAALKFRKVYGDLFTPTEERDQALADIQELGKSFTQYGIAVSDTVGLAAEAAAAGFQGVDLQRQTNAAVKLSILGQLEQQKALETTISLQNAFGMSSDKLAESIDFLNAVENQTVVSLDDITTAVPKVAPVIQQLGGDVKDLAFFLAAMKEGGVNASESANALKSGLGSIINPTEKAAQMLGALGINIKGIVAANEGDIKGIVLGFAQALDRLDPLQRAQAIEQLFGKFQFARLSTLFDNVIKQGSQAERVMDLASASTEDLANMSQKELGMTAESSMNKFKKSVEDLKFALVPVGEEFLKAVTPLVQFAAKVLEGFNNLDDGVKRFIVNMTGLLGVIGPVAIMSFGLLANGVANVIKTITFLRGIFLKTGQSSDVLGNSLDYMNTEQLQAAAVAASLDQAHSKLIQTFTSEAGAIDLYTQALKRAVAAQAQFGGPGIATNIAGAKRKKMASGGIVPGSGNGDKIPAMLEPGEFVVKKDVVAKALPLLQAMNNGTIPGFQQGGLVSRAHVAMPFAQGSAEWESGVAMAGLGELAREMPQFVKVVSNLVAELPQKVNIALIKGIEKSKFSEAWQAKTGKMLSSAQLGGLDISQQENIDAVSLLEQEIHDAAMQMADATQDKKVNDEMLATATKNVIEKHKQSETAVGKAARAFDAAAKQIGQVRVQLPKEEIVKGLQSGKFTKNQLGHVMYGDMQVARESQSTPGKFRPASSYNPSKSYSRQILMSVEKGAVDGIDEAAKSASPSKKARQAGRNIADGAIEGIQEGAKKAKTAGTSIGSQSARYRDPETGRFAKAPGQGIVAGGIEEPVQRFNASLMSLSFAASAATGVMSMFGGTVGEIGNMLFGLSNAFFALITVTELLTKTKKGEALVNAVSGMAAGRAAGVAGRVMPGATKFTDLFRGLTGIKGLFTALGRGLSFLLRFLGPVGIGLSVLAVGLPALFNVMEEQKRKVEGLGNVATLTSEKVKKLGDIFGIQVTETPLERAKATISGTGGAQSQEQRTLTEQVLATDTFAQDFKNEIATIKESGKQEAELALKALAIRLTGKGFAKEQIDAIVSALVTEAGRTDVKLDMKSIDLNIETNRAVLDAQLKTQMGIISDAYQASFQKIQNEQAAQEKDSGLYGVGYMPQAQSASAVSAIANVQQAMDQDLTQSVNTLGGVFDSLFVGLSGQLMSATIDAEQFNTQFDFLSSKLQQMPEPEALLVLDAAAQKLDPSLKDLITNLDSVEEKMILLRGATLGLALEPDEIEAIQAAENTNDPEKVDAKQKALKKYNNRVREYAALIEEANKPIPLTPQEVMDTANESLRTQIDGIRDQIMAYEALVAAGIPAADAIRLIGDENLVAQIKTNGLTGETLALANELIDVQNKLSKITSGGGGGGGQKSPFQQAVEQLKEQKKEAANTITAFAKLRKAGVSIGAAFEASKDPILAAAIASTKVGTAAWTKLVKLIKQANSALERSQIVELVRGRQVDLSTKLGFAKIVPQLAAMGLELEDIQEILNDPALAKAFIKDLKDGVLNSKLLKQYLDQIAALKQIEINIQLSTEQGAFDAFDGLYDKAMEMFDIMDAQVEDDFEDIIGSLEDNIKEVEDNIADIETTIEAKQRDIELTISRPIEDLQNQMEAIQRQIELEFDRPIANLQEESSDLANDLQIMDKAAEKINEKYDAQQEALNKISELNQEILDQQKQQISLADALSQGDISAAAVIAQDMRASAAQASITTAQQAIDAARQGEIGALRSASGLTRDQIEQRQFEISQEIYRLEEQREEKQKEILAIQDQIYDLEQQREQKLAEIRVLEDQIYNIQKNQLQTLKDQLEQQLDLKQAELDKINAQREAWNDAKLAADQARIKSEEYQAVIEMTKFLVEGIKKTWDEIKSKTIELLIKEVRIPADNAGGTPGGNAGGDSGGTTDPQPQRQENPAYTAAKKAVTVAEQNLKKWDNARAKLAADIQKLEAAYAKATAADEKRMIRTQIDKLQKDLSTKYPGSDRRLLAQAVTAAKAKLATIPQYKANGGMVSYNRMGGLIPYKAGGGLFKSVNTDTVPAMLTPGEFVMKRFAVQKYGTDMMKSINNGTYQGGTVYNSYSIDVNVQTDANPEQIARAVMTQIKQIDSQRIRSTRF